MSSLFSSSGPSQAEKAKIAKQEKMVAIREANQAKELAERRRAANKSTTLFNQVLGTDAALGKNTKLGS